MEYVVLSRKWRPAQFDDLVGQEAIARTLKNAISLNRVPHALLFSGSRGIGKTTTARVLAKALNCETGPTPTPCDQCSNCREVTASNSVDVREIDGASNTSVDDVRELRENIRYAPSKSKHKIYIIDEVHMLSTSAFNALLKTLEEPPPGVIFIFATTEPHKIPETILSRCQRFDFRLISDHQIGGHLRRISQEEKIEISESAIDLIARQGFGSLRDALSILDQVTSFGTGKVTEEDVVSNLGLTERALILETMEAFVNHDSAAALGVLSQVLAKGFDPKNYLLDVWEKVRDLLILKGGASPELVKTAVEEKDRLQKWTEDVEAAELERWFDLLKGALLEVARVEVPQFLLEATFLKATRQETRMSMQGLLDRLERLEGRGGSGVRSSSGSAGSSGSNRGGKQSGPIFSEEKNKVGQSAAPPTPVQASSDELNRLIEAVKRQKPAFAAILLQAARIDLNEGRLVLTFDEGSFCVARSQEADFQTFLKEMTSEIWGKSLALRIQTQPKGESQQPSSRTIDRAREKEALGMPVIQKAVSLFQASVEEIKPLE